MGATLPGSCRLLYLLSRLGLIRRRLSQSTVTGLQSLSCCRAGREPAGRQDQRLHVGGVCTAPPAVDSRPHAAATLLEPLPKACCTDVLKAGALEQPGCPGAWTPPPPPLAPGPRLRMLLRRSLPFWAASGGHLDCRGVHVQPAEWQAHRVEAHELELVHNEGKVGGGFGAARPEAIHHGHAHIEPAGQHQQLPGSGDGYMAAAGLPGCLAGRPLLLPPAAHPPPMPRSVRGFEGLGRDGWFLLQAASLAPCVRCLAITSVAKAMIGAHPNQLMPLMTTGLPLPLFTSLLPRMARGGGGMPRGGCSAPEQAAGMHVRV